MSPRSSIQIENGVLTLPTEACYWALLETEGARVSEETLRYAFEPYLPVDLDEVETRFARLEGERWLACGIERERLARLLSAAESDQTVESARPASPPLAVMDLWRADEDAIAGAIGKLEFRSGAFESPAARRWKRFSAASLTLAAVLAAALISWGSVKRANAKGAEAQDAAQAARLLAADADPDSAVDPRLRLQAELRALEKTRDASSSDLLPQDRAADYVRLLGIIPAALPVSVDTLEVDQKTITLRGLVRDPSDYERLTQAMQTLGPPWGAPTGSVSRAREGFAFSIAVKAQEDAS